MIPTSEDPTGSGAPSPAPDPEGSDPSTPADAPARREPAPNPKFEAPKGTKDSGRFSAYDTTLGKYVGGVHDSKSKAQTAGKDSGAESFKVVEV